MAPKGLGKEKDTQGLRLNLTGPRKNTCQSYGTREHRDPQTEVPEGRVLKWPRSPTIHPHTLTHESAGQSPCGPSLRLTEQRSEGQRLVKLPWTQAHVYVMSHVGKPCPQRASLVTALEEEAGHVDRWQCLALYLYPCPACLISLRSPTQHSHEP